MSARGRWWRAVMACAVFAGCRAPEAPVSRGEIPWNFGEHYEPIISVSERWILLDGQRVADVASLPEGRMEALYRGLVARREQWPLAHPDGRPFDPTVLVQVARNTPWGIVDRALVTARAAGYTTPKLMTP